MVYNPVSTCAEAKNAYRLTVHVANCTDMVVLLSAKNRVMIMGIGVAQCFVFNIQTPAFIHFSLIRVIDYPVFSTSIRAFCIHH